MRASLLTLVAGAITATLLSFFMSRANFATRIRAASAIPMVFSSITGKLDQARSH
jgi:predicted patatin/cPLA2 family phospholipase